MTAVLATLLAMTGGLAILFAFRPWRRTTLAAPLAWAMASFLAVAAVAAVLAALPADAPAASHLAYLAGSLSLAPWMAVLGASRPRDRGWPWVVLVLLAILLLPSGEAWLLRPGLALRLEGARSWFLVILLGLELATYGATRFWLPCLLAAAGQALLFAEQLPFWELVAERSADQLAPWHSWAPVTALSLFTAASLLAWLVRPQRTGLGLERLWLDFRDAYGLLWGLRVAERFNAAGVMYAWPVRISWTGMVHVSAAEGSSRAVDPANQDEPPATYVVLENLLDRFVSKEWIAARKAPLQQLVG